MNTKAHITPQLIHPSYDTVPLFVDLEGTLIKTDLVIESVFSIIKKQPWMIVVMAYWLLVFGKTRFRAEIALRSEIDFSTLPVQSDFLEFLRREAKQGRFICLITSVHRNLVQPIADRWEIFSLLLTSDSQHELTETHKLKAILERCHGSAFDYAGHSHADVGIWTKARRAIVVNPQTGLLSELAKERIEIQGTFGHRPTHQRAWFQMIRVHHYTKNMLLAVPLFTAHLFNVTALINIFLGFIALSFITSASYVLNDFFDLTHDRNHTGKSARPLASGEMKLNDCILSLIIFTVAGFGLASQLSYNFLITIMGYFFLAMSYSLYFKKVIILDVILLTVLALLRIIAGSFLIETELSIELLSFCLFLFLSFALIKRCVELINLPLANQSMSYHWHYKNNDYGTLSSLGIASSYTAIIILVLAINNPTNYNDYSYPRLLWLLCPILLSWLSWLWLKTTRGDMLFDPLITSLSEPASWIVLVSMITITLVAI